MVPFMLVFSVKNISYRLKENEITDNYLDTGIILHRRKYSEKSNCCAYSHALVRHLICFHYKDITQTRNLLHRK